MNSVAMNRDKKRRWRFIAAGIFCLGTLFLCIQGLWAHAATTRELMEGPGREMHEEVTCPVKLISQRDPFSMNLPMAEAPEKQEAPKVLPVVLSRVLDLSRIRITGYMRMSGGKRLAVVNIGKDGSTVVRIGQPLLLTATDGGNMLCLVKAIEDDVFALELTDGREVTLPMAGTAIKTRSGGQEKKR